jgi:RNA binding exosome subunit
MKGPIQAVEVLCFVHATESEEKILDAIRSVLSLKESPKLEQLEGHFGNEIKRLKYEITGEEATHLFTRLLDMMPPQEKSTLISKIPVLLDEQGVLYLRFDKQELIRGRLSLSEKDVIRIRVKAKVSMVKGEPSAFFVGLVGKGSANDQVDEKKVPPRQD